MFQASLDVYWSMLFNELGNLLTDFIANLGGIISKVGRSRLAINCLLSNGQCPITTFSPTTLVDNQFADSVVSTAYNNGTTNGLLHRSERLIMQYFID